MGQAVQFALVPFRDNDIVERLTGEFRLERDVIRCGYRLEGNMSAIAWPQPRGRHEREFELWTHTCFEFFLAGEKDRGYYEFNLSPSGNWNAFSFTGLHTDMAETAVLALRETNAHADGAGGEVEALVDVDTSRMTMPVTLGVSAVIETTGGDCHYFALAHAEPKPDFHRRETHLIRWEPSL